MQALHHRRGGEGTMDSYCVQGSNTGQTARTRILRGLKRIDEYREEGR